MVTDRYRELAGLADEIIRCGRCGFCQEVCPVYGASSDERGVARGRNMYARELVSGRLDFSEKDAAFFSECLLCRACVDMCFSGVKTDEIVLAGRRLNKRMLGVSLAHEYIFERLLPDHRSLGKFIRAIRTTRRIAPTRLLSAIGIFGWLGASVQRAEQIAEQIPAEFLRERLARQEPRPRGTKRAMYFIGCGVNFMFPDAGEATVEILGELGYDVTVVDHGCCGLPAFSHGDLPSARRLAMANLESFADEDDPLIVTDCSSCASFLKDYPTMLALDDREDTSRIARAERFAGRVVDVTEILAGPEFATLLEEGEAPPPEGGRRVTFHEPCHLGRYQRLGDEARVALRSLPGTEFVEMNEAAWCCGGAGAFAVEHPDLSLSVLERKIANIESTGADVVASACPACLMQIRAGLVDAGLKVSVQHLTEVARDRLRRGRKTQRHEDNR
jgi:glycolate oxidase iron-sulfur subunit